jgi:plasmid stabilization system protein ParE
VKLRIRSEATDELEEAIQWYAERSEEAERNFKAAIDAALTRIKQSPHLFAADSIGHRACPVERFPYRIVYRIAGDFLVVFAVAHTSRRPGYWRRRR